MRPRSPSSCHRLHPAGSKEGGMGRGHRPSPWASCRDGRFRRYVSWSIMPWAIVCQGSPQYPGRRAGAGGVFCPNCCRPHHHHCEVRVGPPVGEPPGPAVRPAPEPPGAPAAPAAPRPWTASRWLRCFGRCSRRLWRERRRAGRLWCSQGASAAGSRSTPSPSPPGVLGGLLLGGCIVGREGDDGLAPGPILRPDWEKAPSRVRLAGLPPSPPAAASKGRST